MTTLEQRVLVALGNDAQKSPWEQLLTLFRADREAFYRLACEGMPRQAESSVRELAELAGQVRAAVRESYQMEPVQGGANLTSYSGTRAFIPANLLEWVASFLREIDGKTTTTIPGKDYEGEEVSEAEVRFKLGDRSTWEADRAKLDEERQAKPMVLQLSAEEIGHLATQPAYVTYELLHCAKRAILARTSTFKGLKRGEGGPSKVNTGWAFCGKPRQAYQNDGTPFDAPGDEVFTVYADEDGFVFDWDWVREDPDDPGYPLDWRLRFENPYPLKVDTVLELPKELRPGRFDPRVPCYSGRGDCIFCYITDDVSYADRINSDLTVFKAFDGHKYTGFKVKNVRRIKKILQEDQRIEIRDAPGITVSVERVLLVSRERHPEASVQIYGLLIALRENMGDPPEVLIPTAGTA